jgi:predicted CoA-binding protein
MDIHRPTPPKIHAERVVAVLGASAKPERYSYRAVVRLKAAGFAVRPINPALDEIDGLAVLPNLDALAEAVDTVSVYLSPDRLRGEIEKLVRLRPKRVLLNPGAEDPHSEAVLSAAGIPWQHACTLVLLATGQF